jgi:hypothetical protein
VETGTEDVETGTEDVETDTENVETDTENDFSIFRVDKTTWEW